jgi:hypothetical protein
MKPLAIALVTLGALGVAIGPVVAGPASASHSSLKTSRAGYEAQHAVTGTVTSIDRKTGMLGLKTEAGDLMLQFPPSKIHNVKDGERVTVELGIKPEMAPSASPSSSGSSSKK